MSQKYEHSTFKYFRPHQEYKSRSKKPLTERPDETFIQKQHAPVVSYSDLNYNIFSLFAILFSSKNTEFTGLEVDQGPLLHSETHLALSEQPYRNGSDNIPYDHWRSNFQIITFVLI